MPQIEPLIRLGYLFDVLADHRAPDDLKARVREYLGDDGLGEVMTALRPPSMSKPFKNISDAARPYAQAGQIIRVLRAFAKAMPPRTTIRQALALAIIAQGDFASKPNRAADVSKGEPLGDLYNTTMRLEDAKLIESTGTIYDRDQPFALTGEGRRVIAKVLRHLRQSPTGQEYREMAKLIEAEDVIGAIEGYLGTPE
jgi:hypothetical protein